MGAQTRRAGQGGRAFAVAGLALACCGGWLVLAAGAWAGAGAGAGPGKGRRGRRGLREQAASDLVTGDSSGQAHLRRTLLENYDKGAFPFETLWETQSPGSNASELRTGLPVEVGLNFHRVFEIDIITSRADLIVWLRQRWTDPRLAWDPDEHEGIKMTWFWVGDGTGPGGETSEIWTPDLELWNLQESLQTSFTNAHAVVSQTGLVFWSRPGHLRPVCKLSGLQLFPFDSLSCKLEIGSWAFSGLYLRPEMMGEGFTIGGSDTAGESYSEYHLENVTAVEHVYPPYPGAPEEDWPVLIYTVSFSRSWQPYVRGYVLLQVLLNIGGFACFWLPVQSGERLGLSITSMLAAVASDIVIAARLPSASEWTWFSRFSMASQIFSVIVLLQTVAVVYFHYKSDDSLVPPLFMRLAKLGRYLRRKQQSWSAGGEGGEKAGQNAREVEVELPCSDDKVEERRVRRPSVLAAPFIGMDADAFGTKEEARRNRVWKEVASSLDELARWFVPLSYAITLGVLMKDVNLSGSGVAPVE